MSHRKLLLATAALMALGVGAHAATIQVTVSNPAPTGGFALTPLYIAFHGAGFDAFDAGSVASPGIERLAELGDPVGDPLDPTDGVRDERVAADPGSTGSSITSGMPPTIDPGETGTSLTTVDPLTQRFFTYLSMIVPTNDTFIGSDDPIELFDADGTYLGNRVIEITGHDAFDAGTEVNDPADGPAFVQMVDATLGTPEGGVIGAAEPQTGFAGLSAGNGQVLDADAIDVFGAAGDEVIARIDIALVPVPAALPLLVGALGGLAALRRRRG